MSDPFEEFFQNQEAEAAGTTTPPGGTGDFGGETQFSNEEEREIPPAQQLPRPVILWGIIAATTASFKDSFEDAKHLIGLDYIKITPAFSMGQEELPALQVGVSNLEVEASGLYPTHIYNDHYDRDGEEIVLRSSGKINLDIYTSSPTRTITLQDFITQIYLLNVLFGDAFYYPGSSREYVNMVYEPGHISWGQITKENLPYNETAAYWRVTGSFEFRAEHHAFYGLKRVTGVDIHAIPLEHIVGI